MGDKVISITSRSEEMIERDIEWCNHRINDDIMGAVVMTIMTIGMILLKQWYDSPVSKGYWLYFLAVVSFSSAIMALHRVKRRKMTLTHHQNNLHNRKLRIQRKIDIHQIAELIELNLEAIESDIFTDEIRTNIIESIRTTMDEDMAYKVEVDCIGNNKVTYTHNIHDNLWYNITFTEMLMAIDDDIPKSFFMVDFESVIRESNLEIFHTYKIQNMSFTFEHPELNFIR